MAKDGLGDSSASEETGEGALDYTFMSAFVAVERMRGDIVVPTSPIHFRKIYFIKVSDLIDNIRSSQYLIFEITETTYIIILMLSIR
ncbi:MAG: hypothetical protein V8R13_00085 [Coprococcus sp.]